MARLTYKTEDGSWGLRGVPWTQLAALPPMEDLLGHGETRTKEGRELGTEWIMKRFCRIE